MSDENDPRHPRFPQRRPNGQFVRGFSGNRAGRPRQARSTRQIFQDMLASKVMILIDGKPKKLSVIEAMAARVRREALTGPLRGLERGVMIADRYSPPDAAGKTVDWNLSSLTDDELAEFGRLIAKANGLPEEITRNDDL